MIMLEMLSESFQAILHVFQACEKHYHISQTENINFLVKNQTPDSTEYS